MTPEFDAEFRARRADVGADALARRAENVPLDYGTPVAALLRVAGKEIKADIHSVRLNQHVFGHHVMQVLVRRVGLAEGGSGEFEQISESAGFLGKPVTLELRPEGGVVAGDRRLEFIGLITEVRFDHTIDGINSVLITAHSPTISMDLVPRTRVSPPGGACGTIIGGILGEHPITQGRVQSSPVASAPAGLNLEVDSGVQYFETDYRYLRRLASEHQMFAYYDGRAFHVEKAAANNEQVLKWREELGSFAVGIGTGPLAFRGQVWDPRRKEMVTGSADRSSIRAALSPLSRTALDGSERVFTTAGVSLRVKHPDQSKVDGALAREVEASAGQMMLCRGTSIVPAVTVGSCVRVRGMDELDGQYWVTAVRHEVSDSGKYYNEFECTPLELALPPLHTERHRRGYFQTGVVTDNNDPDGLGRVRVRLSWQAEDQASEFLRLLTFDGGQGRGWFGLPEVGDEVLVAYERGNPDAPVVLGCLYNGQDTPPKATADCLDGGQVATKIFRTRRGNELVFDDRDGTETITINQRDNTNKIVLAMDGPKIVIETTGDLLMKAAAIAVESTSGDISIKSAAALKGEAAADIDLSAQANFKSEGAMNYEAKGGVEFKASATQATVEGSAMTTVKGGIVKIN
ncbi:MAG TPA: phage baseplate assembly protein V [candidate division Zixibacteria bacterium]|nr:hypothetical protein [candidate division Zixibacteria bacterium]MDD4916512.1 phage baseplate assembly protein V [candidate division Zixibacteria bacterium]MDM7972102.1 phage baseplate assembly protein V [candidate division Zixibacteria bacterium]HOD65063.1 phage baseplate assembly protein V [candidate division Zixibacteria bacterium]HOZ07240.1 phage baseplate assembly protein V [candidate division Zixibacteria bacterium]